MLTAKSLRSAMSGDYPAPSDIDYAKMVAEVNDALLKANCTTNKRAAMFLAQIGAESGSLRWMEELASGSAYEWRSDLGNNQPGDGRRFKGRGPIQVTGRHNYTRLSEWAFKKKYVPTKHYFVEHPTHLAWPKYRWLGAVWYWTKARNMNSYADRDDIVGATRAVNGGLNNLSGRRARWKHARKLGNSIVPVKKASPKPKPKPSPKPTPKPAPKPPVKKPTKKPYAAPKFPLGKLDYYGVKKNSRAKGVLTIQHRLQFFGFAPKTKGWADGLYGPETAAAIDKWKKKNKYKALNGKLGLVNWNRLFKKTSKD